MNKTRITLLAIGGGILLATLAVGALIFIANGAKTDALEGSEEGGDGLETVLTRAERLTRKPIYPGEASVTALTTNREALVAWREEALKLAARGDRTLPATTPAAFKEMIVKEAHRLAPDFDFGPFRPYIVESKMPAEADLKRLQRQWDDVALIVEALNANGVSAVTALAFKDLKAEKKVEEPKNARGKKRPVAKAAPVTAELPVSNFSYTITFTARPAAFIAALNALETMERFVTVDSFAFRHEADTLAAALTVEKTTKDEAKSSRRSSRGRRAAKTEEVKEEKPDEGNAIVTDPQLETPLTVTLDLTVCDFRTLEEEKKNEEE